MDKHASMLLWITLLLFTTHAMAADDDIRHSFYSGNQLYSGLQDFKAARSLDLVNASAAFGFVLGVHDTMNGAPTPAGLCFRTMQGVSRGQVVDVVYKYFQDNPQVR